ncbi:MAG: hypothetical protein Harvfovirus64_6 [Harvfovirus sp.]|uniref:NADP-dependent oxidoreductase domain-containing protein n=1 Tax=Harvfovirus sp. TaxID=2487768 RepID=A0A3G5A3N9_9VIRU|nr:MAG: hypothetical protein Harvfovirus64_6 [Harvfovirus sp.]
MTVIFGTHKLSLDVIAYALEVGLTTLDTATAYKNADVIGDAVAMMGKQVNFVTKFNSKDFEDGIDEVAMKHKGRIGSDPEIVLLHSPMGNNLAAFLDLKRLFPKSSIGVSNFDIAQIQHLMDNQCKPSVISLEFHPYYQPRKLIEFCSKNKIRMLGYRTFAKGSVLQDDVILKLALKYNCSAADVVLTWSLAYGITPTVSSSKIENIKALSKFTCCLLSEEDLLAINELNKAASGSSNMIKYCSHDN